MDREEFDRIVAEAVAQLPRVFRERLGNVAIVVVDSPRGEEGHDRSLMGLFHGVPLTEKSTFRSSGPDRVEIYQKNIEAVCRTKREIRSEIRATLLHELGHYFGLSEDELSDI